MENISRIKVDDNVTLITMHNIPLDMEFIAKIFENIAIMNINIDMISISPSQGLLTSLSFTVKDNELVKVLNYTSTIRKKFNEISSSVSSGNCKITIIDNRMIDCPGFAAKIFKSVAKSKTDLRIITTSIDEIAILTTKADCENTIKRIESILK